MRKIFALFTFAAYSLGCFAAPDDTAVANRKWVREFIAQNASNIAPDDDLHSDGVNHWVYTLETRDGVLTKVRHDVRLSCISEGGGAPGAIVIASDNAELPVGTIIASGENSFINNSKRVKRLDKEGNEVDIGPIFEAKGMEKTVNDIYGQSTFFNLSSTNVYANGNITREIISTHVNSLTGFIDVKEIITYPGYYGSYKAQERYNYRLRAAYMPLSVFNEITGGAVERKWFNWCDFNPHKHKVLTLYSHAPPVSAAKVSFFNLVVPSAFAAQGEERRLCGPIPGLLPYPRISNWIDAFDVAPEGVTSETHYADPEVLPSYGEWHDLNRWFEEGAFPMVIYIDVYDDAGNIIAANKRTRINTLEQLLEIDGVDIVHAYPFALYTEKIDYCKNDLHVFGEDCKCIKCGAKREHQFDFTKEGMCARCVNAYDEYELDSRGEKVPTGKTLDTLCGERNTVHGDMHLHGGWHPIQDPLVPDTDYFCSCECGYYSNLPNAQSLKHDFKNADEMGDIGWQDSKDGVHHHAEITCDRCPMVKKVKEPHTPDITLELPENYNIVYDVIDAHQHAVSAKCSKNGCDFIGFAPEPHTFETEESCYCVVCKSTVHDWQITKCGRFDVSVCARCGKTKDDKMHDYGLPIPEDDNRHEEFAATHHQCFCGNGDLEKHDIVNGVCRICDYESNAEDKQYHRCRFKSKKNDQENTDLNHTESDPGEFPDNPQESNGTNCNYCERKLEDDIPESHKEMIRENFGCEPISVTNCYSGYSYKRTLTKDQDGNEIPPISYNMADLFFPAVQHSQLSAVAEAENAMFGDTIPKSGMSNMLFVYRLYYPYKIENTSTLTNSIPFIRNARVTIKNNYVYGNLTYSGKIIEDKNSKQIGVKWF